MLLDATLRFPDHGVAIMGNAWVDVTRNSDFESI